MKKRADRHRSIYLEMVLLLLISAAIAAAFFVSTTLGVDVLLNSYIERTSFNQKQSRRYAADLQEFIDEEELTYDRLEEVSFWTKKNPVAVLQLYDGDRLVYDSINGISQNGTYEKEQEDAAVWENYYDVNFADSTLKACIYGSFDYGLYRTARVAEIILTFTLFFGIFLSGLRKKIQYIRLLREQVEVLEGGSLNYPITVRGRDELASLANGLDAMRRSFRHQIEEAEHLSQTNQTMITQISHDLRTPLTAILLYAEILQNGKLSELQQQEYLNKIIRKIEHMKGLSERLLTYSSEVPKQKLPVVAVDAKTFLYDELSDLCAYLQEQGFQTQTELSWNETKILAEQESICRIFNNISSNLLKYADRTKPVKMENTYDEGVFTLSFQNTVAPEPLAQGNGIGIQSISNAMEQMGGRCEIQSEETEFKLILRFACPE